MTTQELKDWELKLKRSQNEWIPKRNQLERQVNKFNSVLQDLAPKVEKLQSQRADLLSDLDDLQTQKDGLTDEVVELTTETSNLEAKKAQNLKEIEDLDSIISSKKAQIDSDMEDYRIMRQSEIEVDLKDLKDEKNKKADDLDTVDRDLTAKRQQLIDISQSIVNDKAKAEGEIATLLQKAQGVEQSIEELEVMETDLKETVNKAMYERDQAIGLRDQAKIEHEQFVKYERKARIALKSQDESLIEREAIVQESSRFLNNSRSNLPPM